MGAIIPELPVGPYREIQFGNYRIIYKYIKPRVFIQRVWRASRPLQLDVISE